MPTVTLLASHANEIDITGPSERAAGWYGSNSGLHTLHIQTRNLRGVFRLEGTLAPSPTDTDWFAIPLNGQQQISFPRSTLPSTIYGPGWTGETVTLGFNFICNCLFLRARLIRSDIIAPESSDGQISLFGAIDLVLVKY